MINRVLLMVLAAVLAPVPAYAMIELLPVFFACVGLVVIVGTIPFAATLKRLMVSTLFGQGAVVSWKVLYTVTFAETVIMACSYLLFFVSLGSGITPHGKTAIVFSAIFASSTVLYSLVAMMPNLWLLKRTRMHSDDRSNSHDHPASAWLLSLPTPLVMILFVVALYAAAL